MLVLGADAAVLAVVTNRTPHLPNYQPSINPNSATSVSAPELHAMRVTRRLAHLPTNTFVRPLLAHRTLDVSGKQTPRHLQSQSLPTELLTSAPVSASQNFTSRSVDPLTTCFPLGEKDAEVTAPEWPFPGQFRLTSKYPSSSRVQMQLPERV